MKIRFAIVFILLTNALKAQDQELQEFDAYSEEYSYELVADRLSCIQHEVPLVFYSL